jgi:hypothetical protein
MVAKEYINSFVEVLVGIVVALALIPVINTSIEDANLTGTPQGVMIGMIPLFVGIGVMLFAVRKFI